jgi:hypothetical protein
MKSTSLSLAALLLAAIPLSAHHSAAAYDAASPLTVQGTVTRVDWTNPHVYIYLETKGASGRPSQWTVETDPTPILIRSGWTRESVRVGALVTVRMNPARDRQRNHAQLVSLSTGNGAVLVPRAAVARTETRATSLGGVWNSLRGFGQRRFGTLHATDKGLAAMKAFDETASPIVECVPHVVPQLPTLPYLTEVEVLSDRINMRSEFLNVDRTIYMDGRSHPRNGVRMRQGHSIGRWEGEVLVVDTRLFADHRVGNSFGSAFASGLPSGPQKHVVERYRLSDDRTRMLIDFVVEDPEYLVEPITASAEWDYAPQQRLQRFGCTPEQARRFTFR